MHLNIRFLAFHSFFIAKSQKFMRSYRTFYQRIYEGNPSLELQIGDEKIQCAKTHILIELDGKLNNI